jgi:hypothetical protein
VSWFSKSTPTPPPAGRLARGVVSPRGASGSNLPPGKAWSLRVEWVTWRYVDGPLEEGPLHLSAAMSERQLQAEMARISACEVVEAVVAADESVEGARQARLVEWRGPSAGDGELDAIAHRLRMPVSHQAAGLGTFTLDRSVDWFACRAEWGGAEVQVTVPALGEGIDAAALDAAQTFWANRADWDRRLRDFAADRLLVLKNENWLAEGEREITHAQFAQQLQVESADFDAEGGFEVFFRDGDLFWGHAVVVSGTLQDGPTDASLAG